MSFDLNAISKALNEPNRKDSGVDFSGKSLKLDTEKDAQPIIEAINACPDLQYLTLTGNTLGVEAAKAIAKALSQHAELKIARFSDMFTGRMKTEIPPALILPQLKKLSQNLSNLLNKLNAASVFPVKDLSQLFSLMDIWSNIAEYYTTSDQFRTYYLHNLSALGDGMIEAGARLSHLDLSDNAFGPIGVEGLARLLQSEVCSELQELRLNNNGLGITGGWLLAKALSSNPLKLKVFVAGRNRLENDGAKALAGVFQSMGTLEELAMPQNGIYHSGISALCEAFKNSPNLTCLNLNDNTIGPKGAAAFAAALPILKNLKSINFGDCLLKSEGAKALAAAIKEHGPLLESLELSHNEIGRAALMEVVEALEGRHGLARVGLAGNSLGGAANKKIIKEKLGASAELSDGEGSEEECESDEHSDYQTDESEDSATEDARHTDTTPDLHDILLDKSGVEEIETEVGRFLKDPTTENLRKLGTDACELVDTHLQNIHDPESLIQAYVEALCCLWSASETDSFRPLCRTLVHRAPQQWLLANTMLRALQLIKCENKDYKIRWRLSSCYTALAKEIDEPYFPNALRETLKFFITSKMVSLPQEVREVLEKHPNLYT